MCAYECVYLLFARERERKRKERRILTFLLELGTNIIADIKSTKIVLSPKPR